MDPRIAQISVHELKFGGLYTGSLGDFRYRFSKAQDSNDLEVNTYTKWCFEKATDIETAHFAIENDDLEEMKVWLDQQYQKYLSARKEE